MFGKKQTCELVMIVDRSGSMSSCKQEVIEGMNKFVAEQKKLPGRCFLTSVIFDHEYEVCYESRDIQKLGYMGDDTYVPRGMTALYDAIGRTIESCRARFGKTNPDRIICVIVTDGLENASKEFTQEQVRKMVSDAGDWRFVFIGANQDAVLTAQEMAMPTAGAMSVPIGARGTRQSMLYAANVSCALRSASDEEYTSGGIDFSALQDEARSCCDDTLQAQNPTGRNTSENGEL